MPTSRLDNQTTGVSSSRFEHAFAIIRLDEFMLADASLEHCVSVKKIVRQVEEARREVERLNGLQEAGVRYIFQTTRLERIVENKDEPLVHSDPSRAAKPGTPLQLDVGIKPEVLEPDALA